MNVLLFLRAVLTLLSAALSCFAIDAWVDVMLGPDCWGYAPRELGIKALKAQPTAGARVGPWAVDFGAVRMPWAQVVRYTTSGVGVHLAFIGLVLLYFVLTSPAKSTVHRTAPLALLCLDLAVLLNATGSLHGPTMGHPRCATSSFFECAGALATFAPVVALDVLAAVLAFAGFYPRSTPLTKTVEHASDAATSTEDSTKSMRASHASTSTEDWTKSMRASDAATSTDEPSPILKPTPAAKTELPAEPTGATWDDGKGAIPPKGKGKGRGKGHDNSVWTYQAFAEAVGSRPWPAGHGPETDDKESAAKGGKGKARKTWFRGSFKATPPA